jgi:hypothetical protein
MPQSASLRFWAACPGCQTKIVLPEWSETVGEKETINFWRCSVCEKEFQTIHCDVTAHCKLQPSLTDAELEEPFLPGLLAALDLRFA